MGWNRQKSTVTPSPKEPSLTAWLLFGLGALFVGALLFVFHANQLLGIVQSWNHWVLAAAPIVLWFSCFCLQAWLYNSALERHLFELHESAFAQQQWESWANRFHAVLSSGVILPEPLTSIRFLDLEGKLESHSHQTLRLPLDSSEGLKTLLANTEVALRELPEEIPLNVILLTDSSKETSVLQKKIMQLWQEHLPERSGTPTFTVLKEHSYLSLEARFQQPEICAHLILVQQTQGADQWSDTLASLLLVSDDVATKFDLAHSARLLRPMSLEGQRLSDDLRLFFTTQTIARKTQHIIGDSLAWGDVFYELLKANSEHGSAWKVGQTHWLEKYAGRSGPFSPWVIAAIASDVVKMQKANCLMLTSSSEQKFINTVTTGNQDGHNG